MHYYKRNIGDYAKKAGKLSMLQHGAYTLLIDACYDRERFPTLEDAIEWAWADTPEQVSAVEFVLRKFFTLQDGVYVQDRIIEELTAYKKLSEENARIAREREANKRARKSTEREPVVNEPAPNHKPITTNHKPLTNKPEEIQAPEGVSLQVWQDFKKSRKTMRAAITQSAIDGIKREADKAGWPLEDALRECCARGWRGFKAEWVSDKSVIQPSRNENVLSGLTRGLIGGSNVKLLG
jgi:uncharacterized protein YdaU (DUF1376 family)